VNHPHHSKLHDDITERLQTWTTIEIRLRRRAARQTRWAMADHLRCCHGARRVHRKTLGELIVLHAQLHRALVLAE